MGLDLQVWVHWVEAVDSVFVCMPLVHPSRAMYILSYGLLIQAIVRTLNAFLYNPTESPKEPSPSLLTAFS